MYIAYSTFTIASSYTFSSFIISIQYDMNINKLQREKQLDKFKGEINLRCITVTIISTFTVQGCIYIYIYTHCI